jgi:hypothetical protein
VHDHQIAIVRRTEAWADLFQSVYVFWAKPSFPDNAVKNSCILWLSVCVQSYLPGDGCLAQYSILRLFCKLVNDVLAGQIDLSFCWLPSSIAQTAQGVGRLGQIRYSDQLANPTEKMFCHFIKSFSIQFTESYLFAITRYVRK